MASIELRGLSKEYPGGVKAVDGVDLTIEDGEFFALLGPSGCGKTTLLRTIAGLEESTGGALLLGGKDVTALPPGKRDVAMVFQDYALFPHMDVTDNIAYPLRIQKVPTGQRRSRAAETGSGLGLAELMDRRPGQLSGGQQQRVALARAIAYRPQVFLFDEPLSNLDARLRLEARSFLKRLQRELGVTTVFVTHDQAEALALADRMAVMEAGHLRQVGTPSEVFHRPANVFVANFIGSTPMNMLPATVSGKDVVVGSSGRLPLPPGVAGQVSDGEEVVLGARPEYTELLVASGETADGGGLAGGPADGLAGEVTILENLGASTLVSVDAGDVTVQAVVPEGAQPEVGARVRVRPQPERTLVYRRDGGRLVGSPVAEPAPSVA